jgi:hypothetical protein
MPFDFVSPLVNLWSTYEQNRTQKQIAEWQNQQAQAKLDQERALKEREMAESERMNKLRTEAYGGVLGRGAEMASSGEGAFNAAVNTPLSSLQKAKQDILSGSSEAMQQASGQMQANLAQQGVRGGQAATQLRRGIGTMGENAMTEINKMMMSEEDKRMSEKRAYEAAKAGKGLTSQVLAPTY